jgi:hypothetical protein
MKMKILMLEDRGSVSYYMEKALKKNGHAVFSTSTISEAQDFLEDEDQIDCIIVDLNMSPEGLEGNEIEKTDYGLLTGWVWLTERIFKNKKYEGIKGSTIIYSDYVDFLKLNVQEDLLKGIHLIPKSGNLIGANEVLDCVKEISDRLGKKGEISI